MSAPKLYAVKNKNTLKYVAVEMMENVGASTSRDLTGQGLGTKFIGIRSAVDGRVFGRASWDTNGCYLAWYEIEEYNVSDGTGVNRKRAVLVIKRPGRELERRQLTVDINFVKSAWSNHLLGDSYPTIREAILDAVDEDPNFDIDEVGSMVYAPPGETWTFIEKTETLEALMRLPEYYFRRGDEIDWISDVVGVASLSSMNEAQIFVTAGKAPLAYACWSSGRGEGQEVPDPAFDYVLKETDDEKWVSMPKRLLEDVNAGMSRICRAVMKTNNDVVLAAILKNVLNGGWEAKWGWDTYEYYWNKPTLKKALARVVGNRPVHYTARDEYFMMAVTHGHRPLAVPQWMYDVCRFCGISTVFNVLMIREKDEVAVRPLRNDERAKLMEAIHWLEEKLPWRNWRSGHLLYGLDAEEDGLAGIHNDDGAGRDVIAINFEHKALKTTRDIAKVLVHEMVHHQLRQNSADNNYHSESFHRALMELLVPSDATD